MANYRHLGIVYGASFKLLWAGLLLVILSACDASVSGESSSGGGSSGPAATVVSLGAFQKFSCTSNWTTRDGALGLEAHTGSGTCDATFPGVSGPYRITITVQTEYDGRPFYSMAINGKVVTSGRYPTSSSLGCSCRDLGDFRKFCPDKNMDLDGGIQQIKTGDIIRFYGAEHFGCDGHGAYAKWHKIVLTPVQ